MTMRSVARFIVPAFVLVLLLALSASNSWAQYRHPAYIHALADLRAARAHLDRPDYGELRHEEKEAIHQINAAIDEIKKAATEDGKDLNDHPPVDARLDWGGRLHRAMELLDRARRDISEEEDNRFAQGLQQRAFEHIEKAKHEVSEAMRIVASRE